MTICCYNSELYENDEYYSKKNENNGKTIYKDDSNNGINSINNMDNIQWKKLFNLVWGNMKLFKLIRKYSKLYSEYEWVMINNRDDLLNLKEQLEYIREIRYHGDTMFEIGDLPINGVLKEILFVGKIKKPINGKIIPYGVEIVNLGHKSELPTLFSTYPSSVHTIKSAVACDFHGHHDNNNFKLESLSFGNCTNLLVIPNSNDKSNGNHFKLPNTIKELKFPNDWNNNGIPLQIGVIPYGVTKLSMTGYKSIHRLKEGVLPNSIKHLEISIGYKDTLIKTKKSIFKWSSVNEYNCNGLFNGLPTDLETLVLHIRSPSCTISSDSNLAQTCKSLKKVIIISDYCNSTIKDDTLPISVTDLSIFGPSNLNITFPNHIKKLKLISNCDFKVSPGYLSNSLEFFESNKLIDKPNIFPSKLTHLKIVDAPRINLTTEIEERMLSLLPPSVTTITFPSHFCSFKYRNIPKTVTNINFSD